MNPVYNKIIITGDAGRGKSTLAEKLSMKLGIPCHSTDDYYYEFKFFKPRDRENALAQITKLYQEDRWIVEGTTAWLLKPGMEAADLIIHLRYKNIFHQWFTLFKRYLHREEETLKGLLILMRHVFYKRYGLGYKRGKMTHLEFVAPHKNKLITLSSFNEIDEFLNTL
ncbi:MAG: hypothetical protein A3F53_01035 [Candidatus Zambryskibacteria bacterium RIFCSPHIGHO2_12_FULL_48_10]|uniref:(d)CMP kinase n=1 Tax=Candidatus Zambryskibacteria bacterium RIFCSPHIGHO2_01_FULL_46_25 TaxID=1802738 RepID=A0A1G2SYL8_9BACT|nr:MAG: Adenylate kinase-like protein kinase [Parcubacteria group bacterium GW2011_GWA1_47_10]OHA90085.1 MAG: hypothetical protein A2838_00400 [Candidatus Zambryskibacteria bacterium RIFCSPHIGHO2_01_FULL_46_25]OHB00863.1 MAG: hypothetical protein A3F53_01035 [Candidatus Zambryskibacteria bacterium RIFCSPHIGHO2_12_FULL_48_10]OHB06540.1 MAG: hypothetical protein A3A31_02855 [Candidatus Zambryskibacteria bacterium RIFCSPLOWO2_01_FULL_48_25]